MRHFSFDKKMTFFCSLVILSILVAITKPASAKVVKKPNFVWLLSEDSGREYFNLYDAQGAKTPNIEKLAAKGMVFDRALSNAPVCSVARSTLATGAYAPRIGVQYHRAWQYANLPKDLIPISKMLIDDGYYASNNYKTDYNFNGTNSFWHETGKKATWQKRALDQPFFHMQTWETTHSSRLHYPQEYVTTKKTAHNPDNITVQPYYPNTATFRYTYARYLDKIQEMDTQLGKVIEQLEKDGLLEDTFIFFFGDHGGPLPGSKGYLFDRGLHTPLVVRIPENFKHLVNADMHNMENTRVNGVVSFIDFAPTLAKLAGLPVATQHDGEAFLGQDISLNSLNKRATSYSYADRFDERSSLLRSLHQDNYQYIRRYEPFTPDSLFNDYRARQPAYKNWDSLYKQGKLTEVQASFFKPQPAEGLYDLANKPEYQQQLIAMRKQLNQHLKTLPDVGFFPESYVLKSSNLAIAAFGKNNQQALENLIDIADLQLQPYKEVAKQLQQILAFKQEA